MLNHRCPPKGPSGGLVPESPDARPGATTCVVPARACPRCGLGLESRASACARCVRQSATRSSAARIQGGTMARTWDETCGEWTHAGAVR